MEEHFMLNFGIFFAINLLFISCLLKVYNTRLLTIIVQFIRIISHKKCMKTSYEGNIE